MTVTRHIVGLAALALTLLSGAAVAQGVTLPDFERVELDNGTVLLLSERRKCRWFPLRRSCAAAP